MAFLVDPTRFRAEGTIVDWSIVAQRLGMHDVGAMLEERGPVLELRWMLHGALGMPTEPFVVWHRPRKARKPTQLQVDVSTLGIFFGARLVDWHGTMSVVEVDVQGGAGRMFAFAGPPTPAFAVAFAEAPGGQATLRLTAQVMDGLVVSPGINVVAVRGISSDDLSQAAGWERLELVGIPVRPLDWNGVGHHAEDQGFVGAPTSPHEAAVQRLIRGAPPIGWAPLLDGSTPAPIWIPPDFDQLIDEINEAPLTALRDVLASFPPDQQIAQELAVPMPPPENSSGQQMSGSAEDSHVSPLGVTLFAGGTDPHLSLALGFGTAYPIRTQQFLYLAESDFMITARWEDGFDGQSAAVEYAAPVPSPEWAVATPKPTDATAELMGHLRPLQRDLDWRCSVAVSWERPVAVPLFAARSFALARAGISPAEPTVALLETRASGGYRPVAITNPVDSFEELEPSRLHAPDRELPITSNPGQQTMRYGIAHQDLYGQWSGWTTCDATAHQPAVDHVRIVGAHLTAEPPPSGPVCTGTLTVEFLWDWAVRSPDVIRFAGRLYPAAHRGDPPPDPTVPAGLQRSLGGSFPSFEIAFSGDSPANASLGVIALNDAGDTEVSFGGAQGAGSRRYRVTAPGFSLDFGSTGHIGLALWAQARERIPPQRTGGWPTEPSVIAVSDPRPPVVAPDIVKLASLPDASGQCHARLSWSASAGAVGYFIYESTETKILLANNLAEPGPDLTLSQRLTRIKNAFRDNPSKHEFTRRNARPIQGTSADITLPRGSTSIHVFVVLGLSAGQVEAQWPSGSNADEALQPFAAPRVQTPAAPTLVVRSILDETVTPAVHRAQIRIETRKGARVRRLDLHRVRVDDAAKQLDTMGPPVQTITAATSGWTTSEVSDALGAHIEHTSGLDTPNGSWRRVWYRAAAWSEADALRGTMAGRSPASNASWVVIPPDGDPDLSAVTADWPAGGATGDVLLAWTSLAQVRKTPLGPHRLSVQARVAGAAPGTEPLIDLESGLDQVSELPPGTGSGAWRAGSGPPAQYRALIRRASASDGVLFAVRISDPLGRTSERLVTIQPGPVLPEPVLGDFVVTPVASPKGVQVSWTSSAPLDVFDAGAYRLAVTAVRPPKRLFPWFGPLIDQPPIVLEFGLHEVPLDEAGPIPPGTDPLRVRRVSGPGPSHGYYAFSRVPLRALVVRLTAPDGRVAEHHQPVS